MNKYFVIITLIIILGAGIGMTTYKVISEHNKKVLLVESKYIIETAQKCFNEKKCEKTKVSLETLYDLGYLTPQVNEVTKEYYNPASYVTLNEDEPHFIIVG